MTFGERIRGRRRARQAVAAGTGAVLVGAITTVVALYAGGGSGGKGDGATSVTPSTPAPPLTSVTAPPARPAIRPEQAFPQQHVLLRDGSRFHRVDLTTTTDCRHGTSPDLAALLERDEECARSTAARFTDTARRSQVTVSVLSFRRVEDAVAVFTRASTDAVAYPSDGVFRRLMTVRSVVFAQGRWDEGTEIEEAELVERTEGLLRYVHDTVLTYEQGEA